MANKIVIHPIADNQLRIENSEYVGLGVTKIIVGVENPNEREIIVNPNIKPKEFLIVFLVFLSLPLAKYET